MNRDSGRWWPVGLMVAVASLSFWLERAVRVDVIRPVAEQHSADFWAREFTVRRFDPEGHLQHVLTAEQMTHYPDRDIVEMTHPQLKFQQTPQTTITSETARVGPDGKQIDLAGNVRIERASVKNASTAPLQINTEQMTVFPEKSQSSGSHAVRVVQGTSVITGNRFSTDQTTGVTELSGRVSAIIQPNSHQSNR